MAAASRRTRWIVLAATALFVVLRATHAVLAVTRGNLYGGNRPRVIYTADTAVYLSMARGALWSRQFLEGRGPFGYSLLLKLVASNLRAVVLVQTGLSVLAWVFLAAQLRRTLHSEAAATIGFVGVLAVGLAPTFMIWDAAIMTESLSIALVCVVLALALRLAVTPTMGNAILFALALAAGAVTRDVNAYLAALVGLGALIALLVPRVRAEHWRWLAVVAVVCVASSAFATALSVRSNRAWWDVEDVIVVRIGGQPSAYRWFVDHGLPNDGSVQLLHRTYLQSDVDLDKAVARFPALHSWLLHDASHTYTEWLVTHPLWTLRQPFGQLDPMFAPKVDPLSRFWGNEPDAISRAAGSLATLPLLGVGIWAGLAAIGLFVVGTRRRQSRADRRILWVVVASGVLVVPHALAIYHGDALEIARHTVTMVAQERLVVWIATAFVLDQWVLSRRDRKAPEA